MNKRIFGLIITILVVGSMVVLMVKSNIEENKPIENLMEPNELLESDWKGGLGKGEMPPDFELPTLSGEVLKLSDLRGKKVILNFWASWCGPCKAEMPHMQNYYEKNKEKDNFEIIAINMTTQERRGVESAEEFVSAYGLTFPIPLDEEGEVEGAYRVISYPTTYFLSTNGTIANMVIGPMDEELMRDIINNID